MSIKDRIKKEIAVQKSIEGAKCQAELLLAFLDAVKLDSQWRAFVDCQFYSYGKMSYECHRFYYPKKELLNLIEFIKNLRRSGSNIGCSENR